MATERYKTGPKKGQFKPKGGGGSKPKRRSSGGGTVARRRSNGKFPLGLIMGLFPIGWSTFRAAVDVSPTFAGVHFIRSMTGVDVKAGQFSAHHLWFGLWPLLAGWAIHRYIGGSLGINRALAPIPFLKL